MGFMETFLMRQLGKLVEIVRHANEILGDGYRLSVVSTDHLAVQDGLTDVLRQLAVGSSRPQPQCLVTWLRELHRDRLRQLANPARRRSSALFPILFLYVCHSIYCLQLVHSLSATVGSKISPPSCWSEAFWGSQNITSLPLRTR